MTTTSTPPSNVDERLGLLGRKVGMMRVFTPDGDTIPVTVLDVSNNRVSQVKTAETDGYSALQVAFGARKASRVSKPEAGHLAKAGAEAGEILKEFRVTADVAGEPVVVLATGAIETHEVSAGGADVVHLRDELPRQLPLNADEPVPRVRQRRVGVDDAKVHASASNPGKVRGSWDSTAAPSRIRSLPTQVLWILRPGDRGAASCAIVCTSADSSGTTPSKPTARSTGRCSRGGTDSRVLRDADVVR